MNLISHNSRCDIGPIGTRESEALSGHSGALVPLASTTAFAMSNKTKRLVRENKYPVWFTVCILGKGMKGMIRRLTEVIGD